MEDKAEPNTSALPEDKNVTDNTDSGESDANALPEEKVPIEILQQMHYDQRAAAAKLTEYEIEDNEVKVVMRTLEEVDPDRKCFRLVGSVLRQGTVKEVLPVLKKREAELKELTAKLKEELTQKTIEIQQFKEKHKIRICRADLSDLGKEASSTSEPSGSSAASTSVLSSTASGSTS